MRSPFFNVKRKGGKDAINSEMMLFPLEKRKGSQLDLIKTSKPSVGKNTSILQGSGDVPT